MIAGFIPFSLKQEPNTLPESSGFEGRFQDGIYWDERTFSSYNLGGINGTYRFNHNKPEWNTLQFVASASEVIIQNDPLGISTLYYRETEHGLWFCSDPLILGAISGIRASIDFEALGQYWMLTNPFGNVVPLSGVSKLGPGAKLKISGSGITILESPWTPDYANTRSGSFDAFCDDVIHSMTSLAGGRKISVGLSGGLDSRVLLALLMKSGAPFQCHVHGPEDEPDVIISKAVAETAGAEHHYVDDSNPRGPLMIDYIKRYSGASFGCRVAWDAATLRVFEQLAEQNVVLIDGGYGEICRRHLMNRIWYSPVGRMALYRNDISRILPFMMAPKQAIFSTEIHSLMQRDLHGGLEQAWMNARSLKLPSMEDTLDLFVMHHRMHHLAGPVQRLLDETLPSTMPLADPAALQNVFTMPLRQRRRSRMFREIIHRFAPELEQHPLAQGTATVPYHYGFVRNKLAARLSKRSGPGASKASELLNQQKDWVTELVNSKSAKDSGIYDMKELQKRCDEFYAGNSAHAAWLDQWLSFECFRRQTTGESLS